VQTGADSFGANTVETAFIFDTPSTATPFAVTGALSAAWDQTLGNNRTLTIPEILVTSAVGASNVNIGNGVGGNGSIRAGASGGNTGEDYLFDQFNTGGVLEITGPLNQGNLDVLVKNGPGTLQSYIAAGYTGQSYLNGGVTEINQDAAIGAAGTGAQINLNGGTLAGFGGSFSLDNGGANMRPVAIGVNGGGLAATTGNIFTVTGVISGAAGTGALTIGVPASSANGNVVGQIAGTGTGTANAQVLTGGIVALSGSNTYTGGTNVVYGSLYATNSAGSATGTGAVIVRTNGILGGGNPGGTTGFISGAVSFQSGGQLSPGVVGITSGIGTLKVGGLSFATGSILDADLSGGGNDKTISTSGLSLASGTLVNLYSAGTTNKYTLNGTFTLFDITSGSVPTTGTLNSDFTINNQQAGASYLWGETPDGSGGTNITLQISGLTPIYNWVAGAGGAWQTGGNWDVGSPPGSPGDAVSFNSTKSAATGATSITLNGARTAGAITFNDTAASFSIDPGSPAGTLTLNNSGNGASVVVANGNHAITANVTLADNAILTATNPTDTLTIGSSNGATGSISGGYNLSVTGGTGTVILTGTNSYANTNVDSGNNLQVGNGVSTVASLGTGNVTLNGTITINRPNAYNITNAINGTNGKLVQAGAGTTTLSGANSGSWSTTVNSGTLQVGSGSALGTGNLTMGGGILDLNGYSPTVNSLSSTGGTIDNVSSSTPVTLTLNQAGNTTFSGTIQNTAGGSSGTLALVKNGTGSLTLSDVGNYDGGTTVNTGTLVVASSTAIKAGTTLTDASNTGGLMLSGNINVAGNVDFATPASNTVSTFDVVAGSTPTISGNISTTGISGTAQLRMSAGGVGADTTTSLTITGDASLAPGNLFFIERGNFIIANSGQFNITSSEVLSIGRSAGNIASFTAENNSQVNVPGITLAATNNPNTLSAMTVTFTVQDNAAVTVASGGVGTPFELNAEGGTTVTTFQLNGGTLSVSNFTQTPPNAFTTGGTNFNLNGGTIVAGADNGGFIQPINSGATGFQVGPVVQAGGAIFNTNGFSININAPLIHDPNLVGTDGGLTKTGLGTLTLSNFTGMPSNYNGPTTVNQGTLQMGYDNQVPTTSNLILGGGTFSGGGFNVTMGTVKVNSNSTLDLGFPMNSHVDFPEVLSFADSHSQTWSGILRISDWGGSLTGGGRDQVAFGGLSSTQLLSQIHFAGYLTGAKFVSGSSGEIVPNNTTHLILGDVNQNQHVDAADILPFEQALANVSGYELAHSFDYADVEDIMDINGDGVVNNSDLQAFLSYLQGGNGSNSSVPEPSSLLLLGLALPAVWAVSRRRQNQMSMA
jgi:autotransporter-associated beta strand protein